MGIDLIPAVFLDRDGVINANIHYDDTNAFEAPRSVEDFSLLPGAADAMKQLQAAGYLLFTVSNQPNYAKGKSSLETLAEIHEKMLGLLRAEGICLTESYYCYHHPNGIAPGYSGDCACRKPSPFFLLEAQKTYHVDMARSWMVGDRDTDIECGKNAGVNTVKIPEGAASLFHALPIIIARH